MRWSVVLLAALTIAGCRKPAADDDADGFPVGVDCDDTDAAVNPDAVETCNAVDDNCNGAIDESATDASTFYLDSDGDGSGNAEVTVSACEAPSGYAATDGDCNDADAHMHPGAAETDCESPIDFNCDGSVGYADGDHDGWPACKDCDDTNAEVSPAAVETCDGVDDNCDGNVDEAGAIGESTWYADADQDGYGDSNSTTAACDAPGGTVANSDDCDDGRADVHPGASETCDGVDQNCNSIIDEDPTDPTTYYLDADSDGAGGLITVEACAMPAGYVATSTDCDDLDAATHPGATEICDGKDNNCDSAVPADETTPVYADADGDGHGNAAVSSAPCVAPSGYVASSDDCDDVNAATHPGAAESCDGKDNNCDGIVPSGETTPKYLDADGDGFGDPAVSSNPCTAPSNFVTDDTDCDDSRATVYPGAADLPGNGIDDDCAGDGDWRPTVYSVDRNSGDVWAVDRIAGTLKWTVNTGHEGIDLTVGPDGTIYVGGYNSGTLDKIDPITHAITNLVASGLGGMHGLNYDFANNVILGTNFGGTVQSIDPNTGVVTDLVTGIPGGPIDAMRFVGDPRIFIATRTNPAILVYTPSTGLLTTLVTLPIGPNLITGSVERGKFYTSTGNGVVYEIDIRRQSYRTIATTAKSSYGSCADPLPGDDLILGDHANGLWKLDTATGGIAVLKTGLGQTWGCATDAPADNDGDGYIARAFGGDDCDDLDPNVNPGETRDPTDGVDRNCDGVDGIDGDGDGASSLASGGTDCDDGDPAVFMGTPGCSGAASCLEILQDATQAPDGVYDIDPLGSGSVPAYCDMSKDGGGWTRVVNIRGNSIFHAGAVAAVGDVSVATDAAKLSDAAINALTTGGKWRYECGTSKASYVTNTLTTWTSAKTNSYSWSMDNDKNGTYECVGANRAGYVFSDYVPCPTGHSNYAAAGGAAEGNGCYTAVDGWNQNGALWAR